MLEDATVKRNPRRAGGAVVEASFTQNILAAIDRGEM